MKVEIDEKKIINEFEKLIPLAIAKYKSFIKEFPELYWKVFILA